MSATRFGLRQRPFPATPDVACYYPATTHERALAKIGGALVDGEGLLVLTGAPGTGKTLLGQLLLERPGEDAPSAFLTNSHFACRAALFQALLFDLGQPHEARGEQDLRLALTEHLLRTFAAGRPTLVVIDEAQHLDPDLLEELRLLGNLESSAGKAVQVVLVGQPALLDVLARPELAVLRQRLVARAVLEPLALQEAADYLLHHVRVAGAKPEAVFSDEALEILARGSGGFPRVLNQVGRLSLTLSAEADASQVDAEVALEALAQLGLDAGSTEAETETVIQEKTEAAGEGDDPSCRLFVSTQPA
jgi:type II secretory pathway predicted ATPase ExeA